MIALRSIKAKWKWPKKTVLYRILVIGIVILSSLYLIDYTTNLLSDISDTKTLSKDDDYADEVVEEMIDENYFVKTPGCRIVKMDVMSDQIRGFIPTDVPKTIKCGVPPLTDTDENHLWINLTETDLKKFYNVSVDQMQCFYASFNRVTDYLVNKNDTLTSLLYGHRTKIYSEYVQVFCENSNQSQIYLDFHAFFPPSVRNENVENNKYNVMILGIDSISKLNFHRMLNMTSKTLAELDAIELHGYNKVDDNTYPNLIPMLTGLSSEELNGACLSSNASLHFDSCHFIWDDYDKNGFSTLFAEDSGALGLFNYFKNGFEKQPTDFYFRTMIHQMEKEISYNKIGNYKLCLGHRTPFDVFLKEYMQKFVKSMSKTPTFSFFWTSSMSHDYIQYPLLIDEDLSNLLMYMKNQKFLDKTILFILADHGIRFGSFRQTTFQGMVEERLPFFFGIFPKSIKEKYPLAIRNFKRNSRRLTTHYDVFETLRDLSELEGNSISNQNLKLKSQDLKERSVERLPRGISLFLEVPELRTCDSAGIESHWCMCYEKLELLNLDQRVQKAARFILKSINDILKPHKTCHTLYLNSVVNAFMHVLNENVFNPPNREKIKSLRPPKGRKKIYDITLKITTKPGPRAEFEATVRIDEINDEMKITGTISRITTYSKGCIKDSFAEKYCFCDPI